MSDLASLIELLTKLTATGALVLVVILSWKGEFRWKREWEELKGDRDC